MHVFNTKSNFGERFRKGTENPDKLFNTTFTSCNLVPSKQKHSKPVTIKHRQLPAAYQIAASQLNHCTRHWISVLLCHEMNNNSLHSSEIHHLVRTCRRAFSCRRETMFKVRAFYLTLGEDWYGLLQ